MKPMSKLGATWRGLMLAPVLALAQEVEPRYSGKPMSLNFQHIDVRTALQVLADFTQLNIVTSDSVTGSLTLRLHQVPWDQVLDIITQAKGLTAKRQGNVIWVAPRTEVAARDKLMYESQLALHNLEAMQTRGFALHYAKAVQLQMHLLGGSSSVAASPLASGAHAARILSERGSVIAEPRTNQLFVTDVPQRLDRVAQLIERIDVPLRQVMIEARIVQASDTFGQTLGARLGGFGSGGSHVVWGTNQANAVANANPVAHQGTRFDRPNQAFDTSGQFVQLPAAGINGYAAASFAVAIFDASKNRFLNLELSALEADGQGKVMSSPRVVTADQAKAVIEQGTELPYQVTTASGVNAIAFRKANLRLEVTPQITPEGGVVLDLDITKDSVGQTTPAGFAIDTKHVNTQVRVDDGGTVMIGGIYETSAQDDRYQVPWLGDLPLLGYLFKNRRQATAKQELLVFITPKMLGQSASAR